MYASSSTAASPAPSNQQHHHHHQNNKNEQHAFGQTQTMKRRPLSNDDFRTDQASNTRYVNVASTNPTPPPNLGIVGRGISQQRLPPAPYQYPPEEQQPQHHQPVAYKPKKSDLVHMPQLGQEWDKNESKNDKDWDGKDKLIDKAKWNNRKSVLLNKKSHLDNSFKSFWKGDSNLFGWATLLVYFLVPRTPTIAYNNEKTFEGNSLEGLSFQVIDPIKFDFNGKINLAMTATTSYVKPKTTGITVILKDLSSAGAPTEIARGVNNTPVIVDTKEYTPFTVDLKFHYSANSIKDPIWSSWHEAVAINGRVQETDQRSKSGSSSNGLYPVDWAQLSKNVLLLITLIVRLSCLLMLLETSLWNDSPSITYSFGSLIQFILI
ncbi:hypothetical protein PSTT_08177 [Puccinia striiformis]|uniref:Uncharacterized protein n=1 Tax=Puccinia striiformis TaxID=27350 RepID=A0A2S4VDS0_9BASI|nr:hypothetical protein PSTT_08177 [Puccinia striiformis]